MALGRRAYDAIRRHPLHALACAALLALCVGCSLAASTAPAATLKAGRQARGASSHASSPAPRAHRRGCARGANFKATGKPRRRAHRRRAHPRRCHGAAHRRRHGGHARPGAALVPHKGHCAGGSLRPTPRDLGRIRAATLCLVNRERLRHGETPLRTNGHLQAAAQNHSEDMSAGDYFEHDGRRGDTPLSRMRAAGYISSARIGYAVGENIAWATLWMATPKAIVASWMASPGHRANILDGTFRESGIGISPHPLASLARGQAGAIYTQDFGRIIAP